jgi:hypothetical protein
MGEERESGDLEFDRKVDCMEASEVVQVLE